MEGVMPAIAARFRRGNSGCGIASVPGVDDRRTADKARASPRGLELRHTSCRHVPRIFERLPGGSALAAIASVIAVKRKPLPQSHSAGYKFSSRD
jgi:hypothetical protein